LRSSDLPPLHSTCRRWSCRRRRSCKASGKRSSAVSCADSIEVGYERTVAIRKVSAQCKDLAQIVDAGHCYEKSSPLKPTSGSTQATPHDSRQLLGARIHQHVGSHGIGDEAERQFTLRIGEADATSRSGMTESTRPDPEGGVLHIRLIEPAPQRKPCPRQQRAVLAQAMLTGHLRQQGVVEQPPLEQGAVEP